jgi:hypothetical protein
MKSDKMLELTRNDLQINKKGLPISQVTLSDFYGNRLNGHNINDYDLIVFTDGRDHKILKKR